MRTPLALLALMTLCACAPARAPVTPTVTVFAAASMTDVVNNLKAALEADGRVFVRASFGATSDLARQVIDGAPCDVFISASADWMTKLKERNAVVDERVIATNRLACVVKAGSALKGDSPASLKAAAFVKLAIADENVPVGKYARQALKAAGVLDDIKGRFVGQKDVRAALRAVATGECEAGFVYTTDAMAEKGVRTLFTFDAASHDRIAYPAGIVNDSKNKAAAKAFLDFINTDKGREIFAARGFGPGDVQ